MEYVDLDSDDVQALLGLAEDYYTEFKATDVSPASLSKWVSAFGNSSSGDIYVGIAEPTKGTYKWAGFERPEDSNAHVATLQELFPPSDTFRYSLLRSEAEPGFVLRVEVAKTRALCRASNGDVYRRAGAQVLAVRDEEGLRILSLQKGITSYEGETLGVSADMLVESSEFERFRKARGLKTDPRKWLEQQQLIVEDRPTVGGLVLFADEPQIAMPKASVMVYRYATTDEVGKRTHLVDGRTHMIEGPAVAVITEAVRLTTSMIESVKGADLQAVSYPPETLHEIITNAVIHRDYSIKDSVHVRVFDDRVEVESPGLLPGHVTPRNILESRFSRNETIERLLHKFPDAPNKNVGEGMQTATDAMREMRLADPEVVELETNLRVYIRHERLDSPATLILDYLARNDTINNRIARTLCGIESDRKMRGILASMIEQGAIEQVPGTNRGGYLYRLSASYVFDAEGGSNG